MDALIYIVDDEEHNVVLLERLLRKHGYHRIQGVTGASALEELLEQQTPDLLLLELNMPEVTGLDILQRWQSLLATAPPVPILVLTGDTRTDTRRVALQLGARDFVNKPFDPPEVLCRIRNLLESRLSQKMLIDQNRCLDELVQERTAQVHQSQLELLSRLGAAAEYRDDQTGLHIRRVAQYAVALSESLGMDEQFCECIYHASQLHDVGKIAIPDRILLKEGKLTPEEFTIMKSHAEVGSRILKGGQSSEVIMAEEIARTHHERWDGSGYPAGLAGEEIPLTGRIVAVCDVFDALTSARPYKRAWTVEEATQEIANQSGRHFDPALVEKFLASLERFTAIYSELNQPEIPEAGLAQAQVV